MAESDCSFSVAGSAAPQHDCPADLPLVKGLVADGDLAHGVDQGVARTLVPGGARRHRHVGIGGATQVRLVDGGRAVAVFHQPVAVPPRHARIVRVRHDEELVARRHAVSAVGAVSQSYDGLLPDTWADSSERCSDIGALAGRAVADDMVAVRRPAGSRR